MGRESTGRTWYVLPVEVHDILRRHQWRRPIHLPPAPAKVNGLGWQTVLHGSRWRDVRIGETSCRRSERSRAGQARTLLLNHASC